MEVAKHEFPNFAKLVVKIGNLQKHRENYRKIQGHSSKQIGEQKGMENPSETRHVHSW